MQLERLSSETQDFVNLIKKLDTYLKITDGDDHKFYNQYNSLSALKNLVICYVDEEAVGCGAFKKYDENSVEIKRMFVVSEKRGLGIAKKILQELENWGSELNYKKTILETGKRQLEAIEFYPKCGYQKITSYGQYKAMENSVCFEKNL